MPLLLPESACTPTGFRPKIATNTPNPLTREKSLVLDTFFHEEPPVRWLPEIYAERYGGTTQGFVDGLRIMSAWRHFPLKSSTHVLLKYCESDRGRKQLALLNSFSAFQVVSDHLAINAASCSSDQLKDNIYPSTDVRNDSESHGSCKADVRGDVQETRPQKKTRVMPAEPQSRLPDGDDITGLSPDVLLSNLRDGYTLPSWAKDRPMHTFKLQLRDDWGPRVTDLYEAAKTKADLDHTHVDEIALLSGILHLNKSHVGFTGQESKKISREVLQKFYTSEKEDEDIRRATDAAFLWATWVQKWKSLLLNEKIAAQRDSRDAVGSVNTEPVVEAILSSYADCKSKKITSIFFIALHVFRQYNNWAGLVSESDCLMAVVGPILNEIMALQHKTKFTCANACTSVGKTRKAQLQQDGQSRQPDVIGQTEDNRELYYGELKGLHPSIEAVNTDILRLAIFTKDSLDQLHNTLAQKLTTPLSTSVFRLSSYHRD
ncbi:hypothetical protein BGZ95_009031 [Linnemannia exigua]|uniref:Uncharacterized protein n=1 Tax=Linnemannia exigua TaxID=604196 RepID=A0AAD4DDI6_9FUNG|nr:hypothetical protein BGZ95_009031 [Linnemannia exigua]